jgi:hypothetical protein
VQAVELLRASFLELETSLRSHGEIPPPVAVERIARETRRDGPAFLGAIGAGVTFSLGGLAPQPHVAVDLGVRIDRWLSILALVRAPLGDISVTDVEGTASGLVVLAGLAARLTFLAPEEIVQPVIDVGALGAYLELRGEPSGTFVGRTASSGSIVPYVGAGVAFALVRVLRARIDAWVGVSLPPAVVRLATREAATWGDPLFGATGALELVLD